MIKPNAYGFLRPAMAAASLSLSLLIIQRDDGIDYRELYHLILADHLRLGQSEILLHPQQGDWFYPLLLALLQQLLGSSLITTGHLLTTLAALLVVFAFVDIVRQLSRSEPYPPLGIAALVILLHPFFTEHRAHLSADWLLWAAYLWSGWGLLRYLNDSSPWAQGVWSVASAGALLMAPGYLLFVLTLPLLLIWSKVNPRPLGQRCLKVIAFWGQPLLLVLIVLLGCATAGLPWQGLLAPLQQWLGQWPQLLEIPNQLAAQVPAIEAGLLDGRRSGYIFTALGLIPLLVFIDKLMITLTPLYTVLPLFSAFTRHFRPAKAHALVLTAIVTLHLGLLLPPLFLQFDLSQYQIAPLILALLWIMPFLLASLYQSWRQRRRRMGTDQRIAYGVLGGLLLLMVADGFYTIDRPREFLRQAGRWIQSNAEPGANLYVNEGRLFLYSGGHLAGDNHDWLASPAWHVDAPTLAATDWSRFDLIALWISNRTPELVHHQQERFGSPVAIFKNSRGDQVQVFDPRRAASLAPPSPPPSEHFDDTSAG